MTLEQLKRAFMHAGCTSLYAKVLAVNDNSKQQVYFGFDFEALHLFPHGEITQDPDPANQTLKAALNFAWLQDDGSLCQAPGAQFILYPQYPEVRFSGFLQGCRTRPSETMTARVPGRVLFLAVAQNRVIGYATGRDTDLAREFHALALQPQDGVFIELTLPLAVTPEDSRACLMAELLRIHQLGWIDSKQLATDGTIGPCSAPQCGGFTLEAELGIPKNSRAEPDFMGWEVKQHAVSNFNRLDSSVITLMTPEPNGGYYAAHGLEAFVRRFGYEDRTGRPDRLNFGGIHRVNDRHPSTHLTLQLQGFDPATAKFAPTGCIALVTDAGDVAASWGFPGLITHWTQKHKKAVYVPSICQKEPRRQYSYGPRVRLAQRTDFLRLLRSMAAGAVYYDPGIKVEGASTARPQHKGRSQFRVVSRNIACLYETVELIDL